MKNFLTAGIALFYSLSALAQAPGWHPPAVGQEKLPNGARLYFLKDSALPLFQATLFVKAGEVNAPENKTGLAELVAELLATGGTKGKTPQEADEWLDSRAIHLSGDGERELTTLTISCLAGQWREALYFLAEAAASPRWDPDRFRLALIRFKDGIAREEDRPETVLAKAFNQAVYGKGHPWGRFPTKKSVASVKSSDLQAFHEAHFRADRMLLAIAGDFKPADLKKWFQEWGASLKDGPVAEKEFKPLPFQNKAFEKHIRRNLTQAFIAAGHLGLTRHTPEQYAYSLLQYILGGEPFTSRLGKDIRATQGLAYSVYSHSETNPARGLFKVQVETRADAREQVVASVRGHLERLRKEGDIREKELRMAKEALLNKYIFWFDSPFSIVTTQARLDLLGYPQTYMLDYPKNIRGVTLKEVREAALNFIQPDQLTVIWLGP